MYYRNFTDPGKKFVLSFYYNVNGMLMVIKN